MGSSLAIARTLTWQKNHQSIRSTGPKLALTGQVVTMDDDFRDDATRDASTSTRAGIVAVQDATAACAGRIREHTSVVDVGGTIFPGLIELHNHLAYNALRLWHVPRLFTNRGQWGGTPSTRSLSPDR